MGKDGTSPSDKAALVKGHSGRSSDGRGLSADPEKKFPCSERNCPRSFKYRKDLLRHQMTHSDVKPFKCPRCRKAFKNPSGLKRHLKDVHKVKSGIVEQKVELAGAAYLQKVGLESATVSGNQLASTIRKVVLEGNPAAHPPADQIPRTMMDYFPRTKPAASSTVTSSSVDDSQAQL